MNPHNGRVYENVNIRMNVEDYGKKFRAIVHIHIHVHTVQGSLNGLHGPSLQPHVYLSFLTLQTDEMHTTHNIGTSQGKSSCIVHAIRRPTKCSKCYFWLVRSHVTSYSVCHKHLQSSTTLHVATLHSQSATTVLKRFLQIYQFSSSRNFIILQVPITVHTCTCTCTVCTGNIIIQTLYTTHLLTCSRRCFACI